jgi:nucleotide-binding universal stress UspA family protein
MSAASHSIVVGVDGSQHSTAALAYAAQEARVRRQEVVLVHAWDLEPLWDTVSVEPQAHVEAAHAAVLQEAADRMASMAPDVAVSTRLVEGRADTALIEASRTASVVVVGRHGGTSAWLGPVVGHVATRAHCPVVAVPTGPPSGRDRVVVGVDGSPVTDEAIGYAYDQAARWGARLVAVLAMTPGIDGYVPNPDMLREAQQRGERFLAEALSGWTEKYPDVAVTQQVTYGSPLPALKEAAQDAGLVVVGSHGRGAVLRFALGSVSSSLLRSAPCPVAVVRPAGHDDEAR